MSVAEGDAVVDDLRHRAERRLHRKTVSIRHLSEKRKHDEKRGNSLALVRIVFLMGLVMPMRQRNFSDD